MAAWTGKSFNKERFGKEISEAPGLQNNQVTSDLSCEVNVTFPHTDIQHEDGEDRNRNTEHLQSSVLRGPLETSGWWG